MTLLRDLRRLGTRLLTPLAPVALAAAMLTACGGGTSQVEPFIPERVIALGDENSVIADDGSKYTINDRRGTGNCTTLPTFAQSLANLYGFAFKQCNPNGLPEKALIRAVADAQIDDTPSGLAAQVKGVVDELDPGKSDMVSLMIGSNDVIALFESVRNGGPTGRTRAEAIDAARQRGRDAAALVGTILNTGARVLVVTSPDMGLSPYARTQELTYPGAAALLSELSFELNGNLRTNVEPNDGRHWGLVLADDIVAAMHKLPTSFLTSPSIATEAACTTASAKDCVITDDTTTSTLVTGASAGSHLWADDRHLGPEAHSRIGQQLQSRAVNNPF